MVVGNINTKLDHVMLCMTFFLTSIFCQIFNCEPQGLRNHMRGHSKRVIEELQIKNIKLHIVTDIKVNFNSMLDFRISQFGWGEGFIIYKENYCVHCSHCSVIVGMFS